MMDGVIEVAVAGVFALEVNNSFAKILLRRKKTARKYAEVARRWQNFRQIQMIYSCRYFLKSPRTVWSQERHRNWFIHTLLYRDDLYWMERFKMEKRTFKYICDELRESLAPRPNPLTKRASISVEEQVAICVYYMGSCGELRTIEDVFGYAKPTILKCVRRVANAIIEILLPVWIRMPTPDECVHQAELFEARTGLPQIIGAIDGSHIPITAPKVGYSDYINRKGWPSLNLQGFVNCDALLEHFCYIQITLRNLFKKSEA